jgi:glycosyltransferase involved in cell wall biosynthesis
VKPDVTIIVSTYDRPDWLAVSLNSIKTSAAFARLRGIDSRILVVDDASPGDATREVAQALGVDYLRNPVNDGRNDPACARVLGIATVDSPYFAFFDDDDIMLPRWVRLHVEAMERGVDVCSSAYIRTDAALVPTRTTVPLVATMGDLLIGRISINTHSLIRTERALEVPWETEWENVMELQVWLELMFRGCHFDRLTEPTYLHRRHDANMSDRTTQDPRDAELRRQMIERYRTKVLERDGVIPEPTPGARRAPTPTPTRRSPIRRLAGRAGRWLSARV